MAAKKEKAVKWLKNAGVNLSGSSGASTARHNAKAYSQGRADGRRASVTRTAKKRLGS